MNANKVKKLQKELKGSSERLATIEKTIAKNMEILSQQGYEVESYNANEKWIVKNNIEQTEEIALEEDNMTLLLTIRQCMLWEMQYSLYKGTFDRLEKENLVFATV